MFSTQFTGFSFCRPAHDDELIYYLVMHSLSSVQATATPTVTFMLLPSQMGWTKKGYMRWFSSYPDHATVLAKFPSESLTFQPPEIYLPQAPPKTNMKHMQLIAIWNNEGKQQLLQNNPFWLESLQNEIAQGIWSQTSNLQPTNRQNTSLSFKAPCTWRKRFALLHHETHHLFEVCPQKKIRKPTYTPTHNPYIPKSQTGDTLHRWQRYYLSK